MGISSEPLDHGIAGKLMRASELPTAAGAGLSLIG